MRAKLVDGGTSGDHIFSPVINEDATFAATMPVGTPVVLSLNGTDDGIAVIMPSTAGAAQTEAVLYGISTVPLPYGTNVRGYAVRNGLCNAVMTLATRAASGSSWSSSASMSQWQALTVDTINNCLTTVSASAGASRYQAFAILAGSVASVAASASATTDTRTAITALVKVWVNLL